MPKFFLPPEMLAQRFLSLTGETYQHAKALRLKLGEAVTVCDGQGTDYHCVVSDLSEGQISLVVQQAQPSNAEPAVACSLFIAFPKADKLEHIIQKATELGAARIFAFPSERCVSRPEEKALQKKLPRWQKIAASAAEQSGRGIIPQIQVLPSFAQALTQACEADLPILFYENEAAHTLHAAVARAPFQSAALITGPEGGFTPQEVQLAQQAGIQICTLGRRILRCETAPLCALSALLYAAGEF